MSRATLALKQVLGSYPTDPQGYAAEVLGAKLTPDQQELPDLAFAPPHRLLVPSANKVGKSWVAGALINWHYDSFDPGITLVTSATYTSLTSQVFKEVRRHRAKIPAACRNLLPRAPHIFGSDEHQVIGYSPRNPDAAQGHHAAHWMLVMDEATAVLAEIADRAETMFSGVPGHIWVCFYNPNDPTTWPYAAEQSGSWTVKRLSALNHPNILTELRGGKPPFPDAVRLHRVEQRMRKECEDCGSVKADETCFQWPPPGVPRRKAPFDRVRWWKPVKPEFAPQILGRWPEIGTQAIWSEGDKRRCSARVPVSRDWPLQIGCDVARSGGNRTTIAVRHGIALIHLEEHTHWPTRRISWHIGERIRHLAHRYGTLLGIPPKLVPCCIDDTGGYGAGVTDHPDGYTFVGVNSSSKPQADGKYPNTRSELWFNTRLAADQDGFYTGACGPGAELLDALWEELTATRYSIDSKNRRVAEGKDGVKERIRRSPDLADCVNLAWYPPMAA